MNRSQLKEVIKSILQKKLQENVTSDTGVELATFIGNTLHQGNTIRKITVQSHLGNVPLEVVEWWVGNNEELFISVNQNTDSNLKEIAPTTTSTGAKVIPTVNQDQQDQTDQMTDAEKKQIENSQREQEKLTNDVRRIEGGIQKLREPIERKIGVLEKAKAAKERKLGTITQKITNIQRKYSKV